MEEKGLRIKTLKTNQIRKEFDNLVKKIQKRVEKYIKKDNMTWIKEAFLKLIHIKKKKHGKRKSS